MAATLVGEKCLRCQKPVEPGDAVYVTGCHTTKEPRLAWYNPPKMGPLDPIPEDKVRIKLLGKTSPKGVMHRSCWDALMNDTACYFHYARLAVEMANEGGCNCPWEVGAGCTEDKYPCEGWCNEKRIACWRKVFEQKGFDLSLFEGQESADETVQVRDQEGQG